MQIGDMMAFIQYAMLIMFSFIMVAVMFVMIPRAQASEPYKRSTGNET